MERDLERKLDAIADRLFRDFAGYAKREEIPAGEFEKAAWEYFERFRAAMCQRVDEIDRASGGPPRRGEASGGGGSSPSFPGGRAGIVGLNINRFRRMLPVRPDPPRKRRAGTQTRRSGHVHEPNQA
jgi:hypothetical protein